MPAVAKRRELQLQRLIVIVLVAVIAYFVWDKLHTQRRLGSPEYLMELANGLQQESDTGRHAQMILETRALAKEQYLQLNALVSSTEQQLAALKSNAARLDALLEQLRSTSKGAAIAGDRESLEQFHVATSQYDLRPESIQGYQQTLDVLRGPLAAAVTGENYDKPPAAEVQTKLQTLAEQISADTKVVAATTARVEAIAAAAPTAAGSSTLLADAVQTLQQEWDARDAAAATATAAQVREEYREKFAAQQAAQQREQLQAQLDNERQVHEAKLLADKQAAEAEANRIAEAAEDARRAEARRVAQREAQLREEAAQREYQAALPDIEKYLSGFIRPGNQQLQRGKFTYTEEKKPLSYGALKALRVLERNGMGHMQLAGFAASSKNDRPGGVFSGYLGGHIPPGMEPDIVKAQNLLEKYADRLIADGKLLP